MPTRTPKSRALPGMICAVVAASALFGAFVGLTRPEIPAWSFVGAEVVVAVAAALGVAYWLLGTGADAPALALGSLAGSILVAAAIGFIGAGTESGLPTKSLVALRAAAVVGLFLAGVWEAFRGSPRSWRDLVAGAALGLPTLGVLGSLVVPKGRAVLGSIGSVGVVGGFVIACAGFLIVTALTAASVHLLVRAFSRAPRTAA